MIVVADTTPLNYLILIEHIDVLPVLYGSVIIPAAVREELLHPSAPPAVNQWASNLPSWAEVRVPAPITHQFVNKLGKGEREAIALSQQFEANLILLDELLARKEAQQLGIKVIGTLGILKEAHQRGLLDFKQAVGKLRSTTFQIAESVLKAVLESL
jgi:predicted nucleic acid-binding protein